MNKINNNIFFALFFIFYPYSAFALSITGNFTLGTGGGAASASTPFLSNTALKNLMDIAPYLAGLIIGLIALVGLYLIGSSIFRFIKASQQGGQTSFANGWAALAAGTFMLAFSMTLDVMQNTVFGTTGGLSISYVSTVSATATHGEMVASAAILYIKVIGLLFLGSGLYGISKLGSPQGGQDQGTGIWKIAGGFFCINIIELSRVIFCNTLQTTNPLLQVTGQAC